MMNEDEILIVFIYHHHFYYMSFMEKRVDDLQTKKEEFKEKLLL